MESLAPKKKRRNISFYCRVLTVLEEDVTHKTHLKKGIRLRHGMKNERDKRALFVKNISPTFLRQDMADISLSLLFPSIPLSSQ